MKRDYLCRRHSRNPFLFHLTPFLGDANLTAHELPGFLYRGFDVPALNLQAHLYDNLGTSMEAQQIAPLSVPYAWKIGLYLVGRDLSWNEPDVHRLPPVVKEAGRLVYEDCQARLGIGAWHKDGVLYLHNNETPKGRRQPKEGHVLAKYFMGIEKFEKVDGIWRPKPDLETQEFLIDLPTGEWWFVIPPEEGEVYTPAGTPKNTTKNREEALRAMDGYRFNRRTSKKRTVKIPQTKFGNKCRVLVVRRRRWPSMLGPLRRPVVQARQDWLVCREYSAERSEAGPEKFWIRCSRNRNIPRSSESKKQTARNEKAIKKNVEMNFVHKITF